MTSRVDPEDRVKYTLITNLRLVTVGDIQMHLAAVLIEDGQYYDFGDVCRIRGFGRDPAWSVFTLHVDRKKQWPLEIVREKSALGGYKGISLFYWKRAIVLADGTRLTLHTETPQTGEAGDFEPGLDIYRQSGGPVETVWRELSECTNRYCVTPYRPYLRWGPPMAEAKQQ